MTPLQITVPLVIVFLVILFLGRVNSKPKRLSTLAAIAFGFVVAGIAFGENRYIGYGMFAIGILLSVIDAYMVSRK